MQAETLELKADRGSFRSTNASSERRRTGASWADEWDPVSEREREGEGRGVSWAAAACAGSELGRAWADSAGSAGTAGFHFFFLVPLLFPIFCFSKYFQNRTETIQKILNKYLLESLFYIEHFGT